MPPKKSSASKNQDTSEDAATQKTTNDDKPQETSIGKKRKKADSAPTSDVPIAKQQRRSGRGGSGKPESAQLLNFLLSKQAEELTRPDDESEDIKTRGALRTYSSATMNPFEELMCAIILSRPISHRLGLRTIRTVLNDPYNFTSAKAITDAGSEKQHQALWDARTQHKDKTAQQLGQLGEVVLDKFTAKSDPEGKQLGQALSESKGDLETLRDALKAPIKGLGATGLNIFFRRVQWLWEDIYPYIDDRTVDSLRRFNLPYQPDDLVTLIEQNWKKLETKHLAGSNDAQKKRRAFVVVLERVIGADLEGKIETVVSHAK